MENKTYTVILEEDEAGECILPIPNDLFEGDNPWLENDEISFDLVENSESVIMTNVSWIARQEVDKQQKLL